MPKPEEIIISNVTSQKVSQTSVANETQTEIEIELDSIFSMLPPQPAI